MALRSECRCTSRPAANLIVSVPHFLAVLRLHVLLMATIFMSLQASLPRRILTSFSSATAEPASSFLTFVGMTIGSFVTGVCRDGAQWRPHQREQDAAEDAQPAGTVDERRLLSSTGSDRKNWRSR